MGSAYRKVYQEKKPTTVWEKHQAKKNQEICKAIEERKAIEKAESFDDLIVFACPKALAHKKDWYITCVSCSGNQECKPGKRVIELLEAQTKPEEKVSMTEKFEERQEKTRAMSYLTKDDLVGREAYIETLKHPNPIQYLMKKREISYAVAKERIRKWGIAYPDIPKPDFLEYSQNISPDIKANKHNTELIEKARQICINAFEYPNGPLEYFKDVENVADQTIIRGRITWYAKRYPDLNEQYHISDWLKSTKRKPGKKRAKLDESKDNDEISIADFLDLEDIKHISDEIVETKTEEAKQEPEELETETTEIMLKPANIDDPTDVSDMHIICDAFSRKRIDLMKYTDQLRAEMNANQEQIWVLEERINLAQKKINEATEKLNALDKAAEIMGLAIDRK